jgi:hypothetical protein
MADDVTRVQHYTIEIKDEVGAGARTLAALRDNDVDLIAVWGYPAGPGKAKFELVPKDADGFAAAAKAAGLEIGTPTTAFCVMGDDRPGAIAEKFEALASAKVNVNAAQAVSDERGHFGAIIFVAAADLQKAATALDSR